MVPSAGSQLQQLLFYPCDVLLPQYLDILKTCDSEQGWMDKSRACVTSLRAFCESEQAKMAATRDFWDKEGGAFVGLKSPSRRLMLDSVTTPGLGLVNASTFSKHRFVLFRYAHYLMVNHHHMSPKDTLQ